MTRQPADLMRAAGMARAAEMEAHYLRPCGLHEPGTPPPRTGHLDRWRGAKGAISQFLPIGLQPAPPGILAPRIGWHGSMAEEIYVDWPHGAGAQLGDRIARRLGDSPAQPMEPRPPAAQTDAASSGVEKRLIGARIRGCSMRRSSSSRRSGHANVFSGQPAISF
jgi:hypothetical protein